MKGDSPFDALWQDVINKFRLKCCDEFFPQNSYTYHHESLNQTKWNDHFLVSQSLIEKKSINDFEILDKGDNVSDHLPVVMRLSTEVQNRDSVDVASTSTPSLKWNKISDGQKEEFTRRLHDCVDSRPSQLSECRNICRCRDERCR